MWQCEVEVDMMIEDVVGNDERDEKRTREVRTFEDKHAKTCYDQILQVRLTGFGEASVEVPAAVVVQSSQNLEAGVVWAYIASTL